MNFNRAFGWLLIAIGLGIFMLGFTADASVDSPGYAGLDTYVPSSRIMNTSLIFQAYKSMIAGSVAMIVGAIFAASGGTSISADPIKQDTALTSPAGTGVSADGPPSRQVLAHGDTAKGDRILVIAFVAVALLLGVFAIFVH